MFFVFCIFLYIFGIGFLNVINIKILYYYIIFCIFYVFCILYIFVYFWYWFFVIAFVIGFLLLLLLLVFCYCFYSIAFQTLSKVIILYSTNKPNIPPITPTLVGCKTFTPASTTIIQNNSVNILPWLLTIVNNSW